MTNISKTTVEKLLGPTGININGSNPWDLQVHNEKLYERILARGSLGFGEAYMEGWWDCNALDELFVRILKYDLDKRLPFNFPVLFSLLKARLFNLQTLQRSKKVALQHYDIGNDLYEKMLDKRMIYSCAYWKDTDNLDQAQENKLDLICRKLQLEPGMRLLDIGCGWGGLAAYAAEKYKANVVGVTISAEQLKIAQSRAAGLPVEIRLLDYRKLDDRFDRVVSVGMFEHVGYKNYRTFMESAHKNLTNDGLFLLHSIGGNTSVQHTDPWIDKYIFPNSMLPSIRQIGTAAEGLFVMEDWHNFGPYYDRTCMAWLEKFEDNWKELSQHYNDTFYRMWRYYLSVSAASFRARKNQLWQVVFTKPGYRQLYQTIR